MTDLPLNPRRAIAAVALIALAVGMPARAGDRANATADQPVVAEGGAATAKPQGVKRYCFYFETTGSRMRQKVCKTKAEWEAEGQPLEMK